MEKKTNTFIFDNFKKMCCLTVGDTIQTDNGEYKVSDFSQICVLRNGMPYPSYAITTENGDIIVSTDVVNVVGVEYKCLDDIEV